MDPLWHERNNIKHRKDNASDVVDNERLAARIVWYVEHRYKLLAHYYQFLAEIDLTRLSRTRREMKRIWIHHLDIAKLAWEVEREQKNKYQQVLMRFFGRRELTAKKQRHRIRLVTRDLGVVIVFGEASEHGVVVHTMGSK